MRDRIQAFPIQPYSSESLREKAFQIAIEIRRGIYDCIYLTLAELLEGRMVTADYRFFLALQGSPLEDHILWIEDLDKEFSKKSKS